MSRKYNVEGIKYGNKIRSFQDLIAWQEGHVLALSVYKMTKAFPVTETYSLIDQMRRCAISVTSNMAEGFSRKGKNEKKQFYFMALGSLIELQNQLTLSRDLTNINNALFDELEEKTVKIHKLINGLKKSSQDILYT